MSIPFFSSGPIHQSVGRANHSGKVRIQHESCRLTNMSFAAQMKEEETIAVRQWHQNVLLFQDRR
jgi:hypothetical protein